MDVVLDKAVGITSAATSFTHSHAEVDYREIADSPEVDVTIEWSSHNAHSACPRFAEFAQQYFRELTTQP